MIFIGKPSDNIIQFLKEKYHTERYSSDDIAQIIDEKMALLPEDVQQIIQNKVNDAKIKNPSLQDGCEDLQSIKLVEIAKINGINIQEVLKKPEPRNEDDDATLSKLISQS